MRTTAVSVLLLLAGLGATRPSAREVAPIQNKAVQADAGIELGQLAKRLVAQYRDPDSVTYLDNLFRLQLAAEDFAGVGATIDALLAATPAERRPELSDRLAPYQLFATAKVNATASAASFEQTLRDAFRAKVSALDDKAAFRMFTWYPIDVDGAERDFRAQLAQRPRVQDFPTGEAIGLIRRLVFYTTFRDLQPPLSSLLRDDDARRYAVQDDIAIRTPDGATISAVLVRPKEAARRLPAAFTFTIYATDGIPLSAKRAAAYGYAGVVGFTRGKGKSPDQPVPYEHDGDDARAVIEWIAKQPWSDGTVGMVGGSYEGFTAWAAAKRPPTALKTIVPYVAAIPGLGLPMENNVFINANYAWPFYVTDNKYLDEVTYNNPQRWSSLNQRWFASGRSYREYDSVDGTPNKWFQRWLQHPAFDEYWQRMTAYGADFSRITIPVLSITGYYDDGQISALQYLKEHVKYNQHANHYLVIGPWDHFGSQAVRKPATLRGYTIDPVAQVDTPELTFQWLDYVMRGGKRPELLVDKINYEEMGANTWKHAPSLDAMHNSMLTLYLTTDTQEPYHRLSEHKPSAPAFLDQVVDLSDRRSENNDYYPAPIVRRRLRLETGLAFISDPLDAPISVAGTISGLLNLRINKKDVDVGVVLYEVMPNGDVLHLTYFLGRASFAKDMTARHLLTPGKVESIPFERTRMVSRRLRVGSRLLVVVDVNKNRFSELNYGTGKDVATEAIADAGMPLHVSWRNDSFVRIPVLK